MRSSFRILNWHREKKCNHDHKTRVNPHTSCHHSPLTLSLKGSWALNWNHPRAVAVLLLKSKHMPIITGTMEECFPSEIDVTRSMRRLFVFWVRKNVNALIYTFSLTIHSFVPFQQFVSDNQKLDYQCDMSGICQRQISGWSLSYNRMPQINPFVEALS